jgi:hypothetical protein
LLAGVRARIEIGHARSLASEVVRKSHIPYRPLPSPAEAEGAKRDPLPFKSAARCADAHA